MNEPNEYQPLEFSPPICGKMRYKSAIGFIVAVSIIALYVTLFLYHMMIPHCNIIGIYRDAEYDFVYVPLTCNVQQYSNQSNPWTVRLYTPMAPMEPQIITVFSTKKYIEHITSEPQPCYYKYNTMTLSLSVDNKCTIYSKLILIGVSMGWSFALVATGYALSYSYRYNRLHANYERQLANSNRDEGIQELV